MSTQPPGTQAALDAVVAGALAFVDVQFDGPACAYLGSPPNSHLYVTLCSHGVKPQGAAAQVYPTCQEAIEQYGERLRQAAGSNENKMLAWRARPSIQTGDGGYYVSSRLVFI